MIRYLFILLMINPILLSARLTGLVGFQNPANPDFQKFDAANLSSRSGLTINSNPYVKPEYIINSQDYKDISDVDFNTWVRNKINTSIINVCSSVFKQNDYTDRQLLYKHALNKLSIVPTNTQDGSGHYTNTYALPPGFVCKWLQVKDHPNIAFNIKRILLEFNGTGDITLYLYNTSDFTTPLFTQTVNITKPIQEVILLDANGNPNGWTCDNTTGFYKGDYYLGYFTEGMTLEPFSRAYREASFMSQPKDMFIQRLTFTTFTQPSGTIDLFKLDAPLVYDGMNPDIMVYEDFTDLITQNEMLFAKAIQLDCQISFLSEIIASVRTNRLKLIAGDMVADMLANLEGQKGDGIATVTGLRPMLLGELARTKAELKKLQEGYVSDGLIVVNTLTGDSNDEYNG